MRIYFLFFLAALVSCADFERENPLDPKAINYAGDNSVSAILCAYDSYGTCERFESVQCPFGGAEVLSCPYGSSSSIAGGNSSNSGGVNETRYDYCVYASEQICSAKGSYVSCMTGGTLSNSCPFGGSSSSVSSSSIVSSSSVGGLSSGGGNSSGVVSSSSVGGSSSSAGGLSSGGSSSSVKTIQSPSSSSVSIRCPNAVTESGTVSCGDETYKTVIIGDQTWMAKNLNYKVNGSFCYGDNTGYDTLQNCEKYGRLYDWETANAVCPEGWHLPSNDDWTTLKNHADSDAKKLKASTLWNEVNIIYVGTDEFKFSALPGGQGTGDSFHNVGDSGFWWSNTMGFSSRPYSWSIKSNDNKMQNDGKDKADRLSVRCLQDN